MNIGDLFQCKFGRGIVVVTDILGKDNFEVSNHKGTWVQNQNDIGQIIFKVNGLNPPNHYDYIKQESYKSKLISIHSEDILNEEISQLKKLYEIISVQLSQHLETSHREYSYKSSSDFRDDTDPNTLAEVSGVWVHRLKAISKSCYFAKVDIEFKETFKKYYIGKKAFSFGDFQIVDWRSDIAKYYYMKTQSTFPSHNGVIKINQRYKYDIENFILKNLKLEFVKLSSTEEGDGVILDPFLVSILKSKRKKSTELEDIIMTIQNKQYNILSYEPNSNFLVQGCAGSGKTMILLHRISYLIFNKHFAMKDILILTPSTNFYSLIESLMNHLEIQNVDTTTVYDYLSKAYKTYCGKVEKFYFPETLHSNDFNAIIENFIDYINNYYSLEIKKNMDAKTFDIYYLYGYGFKDNPKDTFYERFNVYRNSLEVILNEDEKFTKNIEIQVVSLATFINNRINKNTSRIHSHIKSITEIEKEDKSCAIESYKLDFRIEECKNLENELKIQIRCLLDKIQVLTKELDELSKTLIPKLRFENVDYKKELSVDEEKINRLRRKINKNKLFKKIVNTITSTLGNQTIDPIEEIKVDINILESSIKKYKAKINMKESEIRLANEKVSDLSKEIETLQSLKVETEFNFQDNNGQLSILEREKFELSQRRYEIKSHKKLLEEEIINFEIKMEKDKDIIQDIKFYSSKIRDKDFLDDESTIYIDKLNKLFSGTRYRIEGKAISKHHYDHIKNKIESINKIDSMDRLVKNFLEINYNYLIDEIQTLVRLELIGAVFYIGSIEDKEMILVDEAQDYSLIDYDIIKKINKNNDTYINFFGDYQQNINTNYQFNWNGLEKHFSLKIFNLNENYRNSVEITDYYNAKLEKDDLSIGLSDGDVIEASSLNKALKQVVNCKNYRKVIIVKSIESVITREVLALLQDKVKMITDSKVIDFKKINLLSITDVKGMEFDTVLVINDNLTSNEKYIAYTRALHKLIVIDSKN